MKSHTPWIVAALLLAALAPRLFLAWAWAAAPAWDGVYYQIGAESIAEGLGYVGRGGKPWSHYPVGYSAFLGGVYAVFGASPLVGKIAGAVVGAMLAPAVYLLARGAISEGRATAAGAAVAVYPGLVAYAPLHMTEPLSALLLVAAAVVAGPTRARTMGAGLILGLGTLVRPQSILLAPLIGLFGDRRWPAMTQRALLATATALLVVLPWTARNCRVMDGCAFVSTNGGWNLAIGSFPRATGRFETLRSGDGCHIVTGQVQQDRCWVDRGLGWIAEDPVRWLGMMPKKLGFTFDHESFPIGYLGEAEPGSWPEERRAKARGLLSWSHRLVLTLAALAVLPRPTRRRPLTLLLPGGVLLWAWYAAWTHPHPFWPLAIVIPLAAAVRWRSRPAPVLYAAGLVATLVVVHAVFFGEDRYHMVATPLLCLLAADLGRAESRRGRDFRAPSTCSAAASP